jgi:hypothetical protein
MVSELMRFKKERDEIDELFYEKEDFKLCIEKSKQFLNLIKKEGGCDDDFWFAYYNIARCYTQLKCKEKAMTNLQTRAESPLL